MQDSAIPSVDREFQRLLAAAPGLRLQLQLLNVQGPTDLAAAFEAASREQAQALLLGGGTYFVPMRSHITSLAAQHQLPAVYYHGGFVHAGGLVAYAPNINAQYRRAAYYVDRILKGAKPADLPVEQPREFELVINLDTARQLGLTIPERVLLQATEVLE
jgi:putative ABC transport system substrate-binding protein